MPGPLAGTKIVEFVGIGPGPFCGWVLRNMGADVLAIARKPPPGQPLKRNLVVSTGREPLLLDLKQREDRDLALQLVASADALFEGNRPGVMEKLGLGPADCHAKNPRLVYGRMTGWGQDGPLAHAAGHDLNYIAITGALSAIGTASGGPVPPLNLIGDYGGGGLMLAFGIVCALLEAKTSGRGQVVDAAMNDGAATLLAAIFGQVASGMWTQERETNLLDGGAHFYATYRCADGKWISVAAIEPQFYALLLKLIGAEASEFEPQNDRAQWPARKKRFAEIFAGKTRDEWCKILEGTDACFAPVLDMIEAQKHPHNIARGTFATRDGVVQPSPAPRFSRSSVATFPATEPLASLLPRFGLDEKQIAALGVNGALHAVS